MAEPILVVEDDQQARSALERILERNGYHCLLAEDAADARRRLREARVPLMLCEIELPDEPGLELVREVVASHPSMATVVLSGLDDHGMAETALDAGAYDYVIKPFKRNELLIAVSNALRRRAREYKQRFRRETLEEAVGHHRLALEETMARLERSNQELRLSQEETVQRLFRALRLRHGETAGHLERMSAYCALIGERLGFAPERVERLRVASMLHDVVKLATPDSILEKPEGLTRGERQVIEQHPLAGYALLAGSSSRLLALAATIAATHHERFDGLGYPRGLRGEEIPVEGRIAAVADVFDALTHERSYRTALSPEVAAEEMRAGRTRHFDPAVLDPFLASLGEVGEIMERSADAPDEVDALDALERAAGGG
ncbi:MAG: response regulator [Actinomycetota bacterium]|nr:response regulator [Actinomycetota bacterium]